MIRELHRAYFLHRTALFHDQEGNFPLAMQCFEESAVIQKRISPESLYLADCYDDRGALFLSKGKLAEALESYLESLKLRECQTPTLDLAHCLFALSKIHQLRDDLPAAIDYAQKSLTIYEQFIPNSLKLAYCYMKTGLLYFDAKLLLEALDQFERALAIRLHLIPDSMDVANAQESIGVIYLMQDKPADALRRFSQSLTIHEHLEVGSQQLAEFYNKIGLIYFELDYFLDALDWFIKSSILFECLAVESFDVALCYCNMGRIYLKRSHFAKAEQFLLKSLALFERQLPDSFEIAMTHLLIGDVYQKQNQLDHSLSHFKKAFEFYLDFASKYPAETKVHIKKSLLLFKPYALDPLSIAFCYEQIGKIFLVLNDQAEAAKYSSHSALICKRLEAKSKAVAGALKSTQVESDNDNLGKSSTI